MCINNFDKTPLEINAGWKVFAVGVCRELYSQYRPNMDSSTNWPGDWGTRIPSPRAKVYPLATWLDAEDFREGRGSRIAVPKDYPFGFHVYVKPLPEWSCFYCPPRDVFRKVLVRQCVASGGDYPTVIAKQILILPEPGGYEDYLCESDGNYP